MSTHSNLSSINGTATELSNNNDSDISSIQTPKPLRIAIIGGGIGGLSLLLGILAHTSRDMIKPHLFESAPRFSEIGAGVGLGMNAQAAMRIISPALWEAFDRVAADNDGVVGEDGKWTAPWHMFVMGMDGRGGLGECEGRDGHQERKGGGKGNEMKAGDVIDRVYNSNRKKNVHRAHFLDEMVKLLPGGASGDGYVSFGKRCVDIEEKNGVAGVVVYFGDGTSEQFDAVVGCDGVKSRVRKILLGHDTPDMEPRFTGKYAYRGLIPIATARKAVGNLADVSHMFWGYGGHFVNYPIDKGRTLNVVAFQTKKDGKWEHEDWVLPATTEQALEDFRDWSQPVRDLLSSLQQPSVWALFEQPPLKTYTHSGKIALLGDCAHASTPHQGAGAGMAIEDAAVLSTLLGQMKKPNPEVLEGVFEAYDEVRRPRSQRLVSTSRDAGLLYAFQKEGVWDDPDALRTDIQERLRWIWEIDMGKHCQEAEEAWTRIERTKINKLPD